jgi:hypothetical protein
MGKPRANIKPKIIQLPRKYEENAGGISNRALWRNYHKGNPG